MAGPVSDINSARSAALSRIRRSENAAWKAYTIAQAVYHEAVAAHWRHPGERTARGVQEAAGDRRRAAFAWRVAREKRKLAEAGGAAA